VSHKLCKEKEKRSPVNYGFASHDSNNKQKIQKILGFLKRYGNTLSTKLGNSTCSGLTVKHSGLAFAEVDFGKTGFQKKFKRKM
jgi:hypothetical protein